MEKIVTVAELRAIEREADASGLSYSQMMDNAGAGIARIINTAYRQASNKKILALVGSGNNGGDALVALAYLADLGWHPSAYIVRKRDDSDPLVELVTSRDGLIYSNTADTDYHILRELLEINDVLLDGVLGTGIRLPLQGEVAACLDFVRKYVMDHPKSPHVVAVDCPSGVDCDYGRAAKETIPCELTITMGAVKRGLLAFSAADLLGKLTVNFIGDMSNSETWNSINSWMVDSDYVASVLPSRPRDAHKGTFGTAMVVAGSVSYTGAALLAGEAAYRIGAGLVQMAVPSSLHQVLAGEIPEAVWLLLPHKDGYICESAADLIIPSINKATALLVGPGFGRQETTSHFIEKIVDYYKNGENIPPLVFDADGLKMLHGIPNWYKWLPESTVLTPHPGEMSILSGLSLDEIQQDRIGVARKYATEWDKVVVLKGAFTVIASPTGETAVVPVATPALARAGTGDVLAGLIVGLLAQGLASNNAAIAGAWIHASAGLKAEDKLGSACVLAGDLSKMLPEVLIDLYNKKN